MTNEKINEAGDHEVGMAGGQLEAICKDATELQGKIGQSEKDIPGWIQGHITSAYEYLKQANDNYHELMPENKSTANYVKLFEEFVKEKKTDGTISDDEAEREEDLLASAEVAIDDLISMIKKEANEIGGSFRAPGIEAKVGKLLKEKLAKAKLIR